MELCLLLSDWVTRLCSAAANQATLLMIDGLRDYWSDEVLQQLMCFSSTYWPMFKRCGRCSSSHINYRVCQKEFTFLSPPVKSTFLYVNTTAIRDQSKANKLGSLFFLTGSQCSCQSELNWELVFYNLFQRNQYLVSCFRVKWLRQAMQFLSSRDGGKSCFHILTWSLAELSLEFLHIDFE